MRADELQIGDLVMYNPNVFIEDEYEPSHKCYPSRIKNGEDIDLACEGCYEPIQLTEEILKKNGFKYEDLNDEYSYDEIYFTYLCEFSIHINKDDYFEVRCIDMPNIKIQYVHELQHTLRLCKIEKEIEL